MSPTMTEIEFDLEEAERNLVTEDDEPVDSLFSAKQQRLLVEPLYASWTPPPSEDDESHTQGPRDFLADANVGIFFSIGQKPLVPDMFLSLDVKVNPEWIAAQHRSYFVWRFGKAPDVVVEIVSNRKVGEMESKRKRYAQIGVPYYIVYDPYQILKGDDLYVYEIGFGKRYRRRDEFTLPGIGLGVTLWPGRYEGGDAIWLRWLDDKGVLIPTGKERSDMAEQHASEAQQLAAREAEARRRAEAELAQLRAEMERLRQPDSPPSKSG